MAAILARAMVNAHAFASTKHRRERSQEGEHTGMRQSQSELQHEHEPG